MATDRRPRLLLWKVAAVFHGWLWRSAADASCEELTSPTTVALSSGGDDKYGYAVYEMKRGQNTVRRDGTRQMNFISVTLQIMVDNWFEQPSFSFSLKTSCETKSERQITFHAAPGRLQGWQVHDTSTVSLEADKLFQTQLLSSGGATLLKGDWMEVELQLYSDVARIIVKPTSCTGEAVKASAPMTVDAALLTGNDRWFVGLHASEAMVHVKSVDLMSSPRPCLAKVEGLAIPTTTSSTTTTAASSSSSPSGEGLQTTSNEQSSTQQNTTTTSRERIGYVSAARKQSLCWLWLALWLGGRYTLDSTC
eukprot:TRINITY_DN103431_c0_g1_i1.p1 TRINITY_DN103431_c0_g1~~TRINITY_DN103431_c0_g1_i1.p1  ORF type:complete len:328 (-),score=46.23 TRINITY_DN103431_c0_g1_i1:9-932(-)